MKKYKEKDKQDKLAELMQSRKQVSFKVLEQLERDGIIEDYDLFRVVSKIKKDLLVFYLDGQYYLIDTVRKDFKLVDNSLLQDRYFLLNRCITNNIQGFIQREGVGKFDKLSTAEFIEVMLMHKDNLLRTEEER